MIEPVQFVAMQVTVITRLRLGRVANHTQNLSLFFWHPSLLSMALVSHLFFHAERILSIGAVEIRFWSAQACLRLDLRRLAAAPSRFADRLQIALLRDCEKVGVLQRNLEPVTEEHQGLRQITFSRACRRSTRTALTA